MTTTKTNYFKFLAIIIILISTVIFVFNITYSNNVLNKLSSDQSSFINNTQSNTVNNIEKQKFANINYNVTLLFSVTNKNKTIYSSSVKKSIVSSLKKLHGIKNYVSVYSTGMTRLVSNNKKQTVVYLNLKGSPQSQYYNLLHYQNIIKNPNFNLQLGGSLVIKNEATAQVKKDLILAEKISLPILAILLVFVFRSLIAAFIPLLLGIFSIFGGLSVLRALTLFFKIDQYSVDIITLLGLGLSVDYSLLIVSRFREELNKNQTTKSAIMITLSTAGKTILFSGMTVIISLLALSFFPIILLRSVSLGGASAIIIALFGALFIVPSILYLLGDNINKFSFMKQKDHNSTNFNVFYKIAHYVLKQPYKIICLALFVIFILIWPLGNINLTSQNYRDLAKNSQGRVVAKAESTNFSKSYNNPIIIMYTSKTILTKTSLSHFIQFENSIAKLPNVSRIISFNTIKNNINKLIYSNEISKIIKSPYINGNTIQLVVDYKSGNPTSSLAQNLVNKIHTITKNKNNILIGGLPAVQYDLMNTILHYLPYVIITISLSIILILGFLLKSFTLPLQAIVINSLSLLASLGILVWIFQEGHIIFFTRTNGLDITTLIVIFGISFGLSMDYSVFLYSRIHESIKQNKNNILAIERGLAVTGPVITEAATLFFIVVIAFTSSKIAVLQQIGLGMGLAVILDAFFIRIIIVPALMKILGKFNWIYFKT